MAFLATGCMTSRLEESKSAATGIDAGESIVILSGSYHKGKPVEENFVACVREEIGDKGISVYPESRFADELFPWFEPRTAPQNIAALPELLTRRGVADRIRERGIRYLVWLNGSTEKVGGGGSLSCTLGGCLGFGWWEDNASYDAAVWDLRNQSDAGSVSADVHGTSMIPAIVVPVPLIARTQSAACNDIAGQLRSFIQETEPTS
jgi:hypothetical protein